MLIPKTFKAKLSQTMTYPIGAEVVSEALVGVPQFEKLMISFTPPNFGSASIFQDARKQNQSYKIFEVSMHHHLKNLTSPKRFIEEGFYNENWEIHIYAVPRELKAIAKQLLLNEALPKAKEWCEKPRTEMWRTGRKYFQVLFNEKESKIFIKQD
jgi:hypothetical protein